MCGGWLGGVCVEDGFVEWDIYIRHGGWLGGVGWWVVSNWVCVWSVCMVVHGWGGEGCMVWGWYMVSGAWFMVGCGGCMVGCLGCECGELSNNSVQAPSAST